MNKYLNRSNPITRKNGIWYEQEGREGHKMWEERNNPVGSVDFGGFDYFLKICLVQQVSLTLMAVPSIHIARTKGGGGSRAHCWRPRPGQLSDGSHFLLHNSNRDAHTRTIHLGMKLNSAGVRSSLQTTGHLDDTDIRCHFHGETSQSLKHQNACEIKYSSCNNIEGCGLLSATTLSYANIFSTPKFFRKRCSLKIILTYMSR